MNPVRSKYSSSDRANLREVLSASRNWARVTGDAWVCCWVKWVLAWVMAVVAKMVMVVNHFE